MGKDVLTVRIGDREVKNAGRAGPKTGHYRRLARILIFMNWHTSFSHRRPRFKIFRPAVFVCALLLAGGQYANAQESPQAPLAAPPEHDVRRMGNTPEPAAPPSLPPEEIIKKFSQKEDEYVAARPGYGYRKTVRIDEFDPQGKLVGQFLMATET